MGDSYESVGIDQEGGFSTGGDLVEAGRVTSGINSNSILASKTYPDNGMETYKHNRQGQSIEFKDPSLTVHRYAYDRLGRQTSDTVAPTSGNPQNIDTKNKKPVF